MTDHEFLALSAILNKDPEARRLARQALDALAPAPGSATLTEKDLRDAYEQYHGYPLGNDGEC